MKDIHKAILVALVVYLLLLCGRSSAQLVKIENESAATRKVCHNGYCTLVRDTQHGSGVIVGRDDRTTFVLTAAHVVREKSRSLTVMNKPAIVVQLDAQNDIAVLRVNHIWPDTPDVVFGEDLTAGETVRRQGFAGTDSASAFETTAISARWVNGAARDGDSGGPVTDADNRLRGIITHKGDGRTLVTPVSCCRQFVIRCVPVWRPQPLVVFRKDVPSPPDDRAPDVPDVEKTARIRELEQQVADLRQQLVDLKPIRGERGETGPAGQPGPQGPSGPTGPPGPAGSDSRPIDVQIVAVDPNGKETVIAAESYPRGTPIKLRFREEWIKSGE